MCRKGEDIENVSLSVIVKRCVFTLKDVYEVDDDI